MAYNFPKVASIVVSARYAVAATNEVLSAVTFDNLDFGAVYMQGSAPYTGFICPAVGTFEFRISGWGCGGSEPIIQITSKRSGSTVYDQSWTVPNACGLSHDHWYIPNCQVGDIVTFQLSENITGGYITSITDPTIQGQSNFQVTYWPQYS